MTGKIKHWTERTITDFLYSMGADFVHQLESEMKGTGTTRVALAAKLGVSVGRVSQVLNNPGNLTLRAIIRYARACGRKVSIVTYDDGDPQNETGPVRAGIFTSCWELAGKPHDFFDMSESQRAANTASFTAAHQFSVATIVSNASLIKGQDSSPSGRLSQFKVQAIEGWERQASNQPWTNYSFTDSLQESVADTSGKVTRPF